MGLLSCKIWLYLFAFNVNIILGYLLQTDSGNIEIADKFIS